MGDCRVLMSVRHSLYGYCHGSIQAIVGNSTTQASETELYKKGWWARTREPANNQDIPKVYASNFCFSWLSSVMNCELELYVEINAPYRCLFHSVHLIIIMKTTAPELRMTWKKVSSMKVSERKAKAHQAESLKKKISNGNNKYRRIHFICWLNL